MAAEGAEPVSKEFANVYQDQARADAYAQLEFPGTYFLAFRDLPALFHEHVRGRVALDFGCGTGRSTRFLRALGFSAIGVDVADSMLARARELCEGGGCGGGLFSVDPPDQLVVGGVAVRELGDQLGLANPAQAPHPTEDRTTVRRVQVRD